MGPGRRVIIEGDSPLCCCNRLLQRLRVRTQLKGPLRPIASIEVQVGSQKIRIPQEKGLQCSDCFLLPPRQAVGPAQVN